MKNEEKNAHIRTSEWWKEIKENVKDGEYIEKAEPIDTFNLSECFIRFVRFY